MNWFTDLMSNPFLITAVSSWLIAQVSKTVIHACVNRQLDITRLFGDGGMPSGHSATVVSLATISALHFGTGSFQFAFCAILALVVCHDAMGVRLETGKQAMLLNEMVKLVEVLSSNELPEVKLKEFVGHTPAQVLVGVLLGIANAFLMYHVIL